MKEAQCSNRAYLGDLKHIGLNSSLSPRNNAQTNFVNRMDHHPQLQPNSIAESQIKQIRLKYHSYIKTQFTLLHYMHDELGIDGTKYRYDNIQRSNNGIQEMLQQSRIITQKIVERWKTVEDREKQMENMKEVVLLKATQATQKLAESQREKRQLEEIIVKMEAKARQQSLLMSNFNGQGSADSHFIERIKQLKKQNTDVSAQNQKLKDQISQIKQSSKVQTQETNALVSNYEVRMEQLKQNLVQSEDKLINLIGQNKNLFMQIQILKQQKVHYEQQRQSAMKSLNSITIRVKEYQKQHSEQKQISQNQINMLRNQFKALEQKYLEVMMRSAKWNLVSKTLNLQLANTKMLRSSVESQTFDYQPQYLQMQKVIKQFEGKSQNRLNDLCRANQALFKQNEMLVKKFQIVQNNNQSLRRQLDNKKIVLQKITQQGSLLTEDMAHLNREDIMKTIGSKIETLRDIMRSLEGGQNLQSSIDVRCKNNIVNEDVKLQNLFERKINKSTQKSNRQASQIKQLPLPTKRIEHQVVQRRPSKDHRELNHSPHNQAVYLQTFPMTHLTHQPPTSMHLSNNVRQHGVITNPQPFNHRIISPTAHKGETKRIIPVSGTEKISQSTIKLNK